MMFGRTQKKLFLLIMAAIMLACVPTLAPASTPIPTFDPNSLGTLVAETANAAFTETQFYITPTPTFTLTPTATKTPTETPTPTNTFIFVLYSPTASTTPPPPGQTGVDFACERVSQTPEDNSTLGAGVSFSVRWQVKNTGMQAWDSNNVDYRYKSGTKMHRQPAYDLYKNIAPGEVADIIVDMIAPTSFGKHETVWVVRAGKKEFCKLTLTILTK